MKTLVTGGAGFIGSHLCAALLADGHEVLCLDNLLTGSERNIAAVLDRPGFTFLRHDVVQPMDLRVDAIFHLASPASVPDYLSRPIQTLLANSIGTRNMVELARIHGARLLFASTSEVYGDPLEHPQRETYFGNVSSIGPRACYDESKRFGEALTMEYWRSYGTDVRIVRIFNTYGPNSRPDDGRIVPNFITQALRDEPITIYGTGEQTRSFCYVSDLVSGLLAALRGENTTGEVFNLGNPDEYTVNEFAHVIAEQVGSSAGVVHRPLPVDDPTRRCPDITKARTVLGWEPRVDLTTGIEYTLQWFREALNLPSPV